MKNLEKAVEHKFDPDKQNITELFDLGYTYANLGSDLIVLWKWAEKMKNIISSMR